MDNTPFGRLPRGLRDRIYEYAVVHPHGLKMRQYSTTHGKTKMPCRVARTSSSKNATIALAKTCKQLHEETIGLYYKLNTFYFPFNSSSVECLTQFLHSLKPEYHNMVRHVVFRALDKHISWHEKRGDLLMNHWYEVMHQIVVNAKTLLPGPIFVGGHFQFDCDPVRLRPQGHFDLVLDMNRIQHSILQNWHAAYALNCRLGYGQEGTAIAHLFHHMAAFAGEFGPDYEQDGEQSLENRGDAIVEN